MELSIWILQNPAWCSQFNENFVLTLCLTHVLKFYNIIKFPMLTFKSNKENPSAKACPHTIIQVATKAKLKTLMVKADAPTLNGTSAITTNKRQKS